MKRLTAFLGAMCLLISGCSLQPEPVQTRYTATFLGLFDTVTTVVGFSDSQEAFEADAGKIRQELEIYHQLFDIYNTYEGIHNLKTVNDQAGIAPVKVDGRIIALLKDCIGYYRLTEGKVNVGMGSVLQLWHAARQEAFADPAAARLPDEAALKAAAQHTDLASLVIDEEASTVFLADPQMRLDVGAVAKGWSAQRVCEKAPGGLLISVGGNVCATGPKPDESAWVVGIQDPDDAGKYLHTVYVSGGSVVTSGDYQRAYTVEGRVYHHIVDPATCYPGGTWRSVSIVCGDSGLADALSTALFLMSREDGQDLLEACGAEAMWVDAAGKIFCSPGFEDLIRT